MLVLCDIKVLYDPYSNLIVGYEKPVTFVNILFVTVVSEMQVILLLEWELLKFTACCTSYKASVWINETYKYHTIINVFMYNEY